MSNPPQYPQGPNQNSGQGFGQTPPAEGAPQYSGNFQQAPGNYQSYPGGAGPAVEAPKGRGMLVKVLPVLLVIALLVGLRVFGSQLFSSGLKEGSCITLTKKGTSYQDHKADCNADFSFTVVKKTKTKADCSDNYSVYTVTSNKTSTYYCLMENLQEGKCYQQASGDNPGDEVVACGSSATFKVAKRIDGQADENACSPQQKAAIFDMDPKRTYCLSDPSK